MMMYVSLEHDSINFNAQCVDLKKKKKKKNVFTKPK